MASDKKIRVAIVGLGFGAEFIPIYQAHPNAEMYAVCRRDKKELDKVGDRYGIAKRYTSYDDLLENDVELFTGYRRELMKHGVFELPLNLKRSHFSYAHTDADVDKLLESTEAAVTTVLATR